MVDMTTPRKPNPAQRRGLDKISSALGVGDDAETGVVRAQMDAQKD